MASHLLLADWIDERFRPEPVLIDQGYPLGPHALVAGLATVLHASSIDVFAGLTLAIPALTALVAYSALDGLRPVARGRSPRRWSRCPTWRPPTWRRRRSRSRSWPCSCSPSPCCWRGRSDWRDAIPLGVLAAGVVYVYSFPGLAWLGGVALVWGAIQLWRASSAGVRVTPDGGSAAWTRGRCVAWTRSVAGSALPRASALAVARWRSPLLSSSLPSSTGSRLRRLPRPPPGPRQRGRARQPARPALAARGARDLADERVPALRRARAALPAALFYLGGAVRARLPWPRAAAVDPPPRRRDPGGPARGRRPLPAGAAPSGTVYTCAKALAIAAPLDRPDHARRAARRRAASRCARLGAAVRASPPPSPASWSCARRRWRPRTTPTSWPRSGRWSRVRSCSSSAATTSSSTSCAARGRSRTCATSTTPTSSSRTSSSTNVGSKFDFDSVTAETLAGFPYVLTTRAAYASGPPPGYELVEDAPSPTCSGSKGRSPLGREPAETGAEPGPRRTAARRGGPSAASSFAAAAGDRRGAGWSRTDGRERRVGDASTLEPARRAPGTSRFSTTRPGR